MGASILPLIFSLLIFECANCETYYITPSAHNTSCQEYCITISEFAESITALLRNSTTLTFMSGIHNLDTTLAISEINFFSMESASSETEKVAINCAMPICFQFVSVFEVRVNNLSLRGFTMTESIHSPNISGYSNSNVAIIVQESKLHVLHCYFDNFRGFEWKNEVTTENVQVLVGGAIISTKCDIHIVDSVFLNNSAQLGGAIYVESGSNLSIINSTFLNHSTMCRSRECYGGVIFSIKSSINITASVFVNNEMRSSTKHVLGGAVTSLSCKITIQLTSFINNIAYYGGAIFLGSCQVTLFKVHFMSNRALYGGGAVFTEDCFHFYVLKNVYINNTAFEAGGAILLKHSELLLCDSLLTDNVAKFQGGALFSFRSNITLSMRIVMANNKAYCGGAVRLTYSRLTFIGNNAFIKNKGVSGTLVLSHCIGHISGRLSVRYNHGSIIVLESTVRINAMSDVSNNNYIVLLGKLKHYPGGGITSILSTVIFTGKVNLVQNHAVNGGGILSIASTIIINNITYLIHNSAESGGGICLYYSKLNLRSSIILYNNHAKRRGGGIHSIGSTVVTQQPHCPGNACYFFMASNFADQGGGLCLEAGSRIYSASHHIVILYFANNSANKGGAIYIADDTNIGACAGSQENVVGISKFNSECFYQPAHNMSRDHLRPPNLKNHFIFSNNSAAVSGAILFGGLLDRCTINDHKYSEHPELIDFIVNATASDAVRVCLCYDNQKNCSHQYETIRIKKGEMFDIQAVIVDQVNNTLIGTIIGYLNGTEINSGERSLGIGQRAQNVYSSCTNLSYEVFSPKHKEKLMLFAVGPCKNAGISKLSIDILFLPCICPLGFQQSHREKVTVCECECDQVLHPLVRNCNASTGLVVRDQDIWTAAIDNYTNYLVCNHCPFDYCLPPIPEVSINLSSPDGSDAQCALNRSGILCGTCPPGLSLSLGSSHCIVCPRYWPALFVTITMGAIFSGICLVLCISVLKLTVDVGTLNGFVFFANIIDSNTVCLYLIGVQMF